MLDGSSFSNLQICDFLVKKGSEISLLLLVFFWGGGQTRRNEKVIGRLIDHENNHYLQP